MYSFNNWPNPGGSPFGLSKIPINPVASADSAHSTMVANISDLVQLRMDATGAFWASNDSVPAGTPVCISTTNVGVGTDISIAFDHSLATNKHRKRVVGVLLDDYPARGDAVRMKLYGRVIVPKARWGLRGPPGATVYLKAGDISDASTQGILTLDPAEAANPGSPIIVGLNSYGASIILRPKLSATV